MIACFALPLIACGDDAGTTTSSPAPSHTQCPELYRPDTSAPWSPEPGRDYPCPAPHTTAATPATTATPPPSTPLAVVTGLFDDPRETAVAHTRALTDAPDLRTFTPWDRQSSMLYDTATGEEVNLGPGRYGVFSPDSRLVAWIADDGSGSFTGEGWVMDLETRERQSLGEARVLRFMEDGRLAIGVGASDAEALDLATGVREPVNAAGAFNPPFPRTTPDGYELIEAVSQDDDGRYRGTWTLRDPARGAVLLRFDAFRATPAGRGWLAVATSPRIDAPQQGQLQDRGTVNVFLVEIATGRAQFIATSAWSYANWPLVANERYVAWTDDYCGFPENGPTRIYDRTTGEITELDASLWLEALTDDGTLAVGDFGANALIDIATLQYTVRLVDVGDNAWSPDYRWASAGQNDGHGGLCP
ncbi:MAG TPA: hypothetical protein VNM91_05210 [Dehalococcoidia bacterium]|nr:hypothetical protein [Dehalococcoidia bacterium]